LTVFRELSLFRRRARKKQNAPAAGGALACIREPDDFETDSTRERAAARREKGLENAGYVESHERLTPFARPS
jgi:hypothetical protein